MNKSSCETKCGLGTVTGHCVWRQGSGVGIVSKYSTCSPNLVTCPNNVCDSLELVYPSLCPQDCTSKYTFVNHTFSHLVFETNGNELKVN